MSVSTANHDCSGVFPCPWRGTLSPVAVPYAHGAGRCDPPQAAAATVWATGQLSTPPAAPPHPQPPLIKWSAPGRTAVSLTPRPVFSCPQSTSHKANKPAALDNISEHVTSFQKDFFIVFLARVHCTALTASWDLATAHSSASAWHPSL